MSAIAFVVIAGSAQASVTSGALSQLAPSNNCISQEAAGGDASCTLIPANLEGSKESVVSPDRGYVYALSSNTTGEGTVTEFARNLATGALQEIGCLTSGSSACALSNSQTGIASLGEADAIAISPDGKDIYVTSSGDLVTLRREPATGQLEMAGCASHEKLAECSEKEVHGLGDAKDVIVSPDGTSVYVTGQLEQAIAEFSRNTETGALTFSECITGHSSGCSTVEAPGLEEANKLTISPDGQNVYVSSSGFGSNGGGDIAEFERNTGTGALTQLGGENACITSIGEKAHGFEVENCVIVEHINGPRTLVASPDGDNIYAADVSEDAVLEFTRNMAEQGALEELSGPNACVSSESTLPTGCTRASMIGFPGGLAISPDGEDVYVSGRENKSVASFKRESGGELKQFTSPYECVTEETSGCASKEATGLGGASGISISPDGVNLYVSADNSDAIAEFARTITPTVSSVNVTYGPPEGGTEVRVNGSGFSEDNKGVKVSFGGTPAASATVESASLIVAVSPTGIEGTPVAVRVENEAGVSTEVPSDQFSYTDKPTVIGVSPDIGSEAGGTVVTITGSRFLGATAVRFGSKSATDVAVDPSGESITATSPPGSKTVDVVVETASGVSSTGAANKFTDISGSAKPLSGLFLQGYCEGAGYKGVALERGEVGGPGFAYENWACVASDGVETLIADTGPAPSMEDACLQGNPGVSAYGYPTEPNSAYAWGCYSVVPPATVTKVGPAEGLTAGATAVTITGTNLEGASEVTFGGTKATEVVVKSNTEVTAKTPAHGAGTVEVCVTATGGSGCKSAAYTYIAPPKVTSVEPGEGPEAGSTHVTVKGEHLEGATKVGFGSAAASEVHVVSATELTVKSPAHAPGTVDVVVLTPRGESTKVAADHFTYQAPISQTPITSSISTPIFIPKTVPVPVPVLAVSGNVAPVSGTVLVKLPGSSSFVPLTSLRSIPFGTVIEATHGKVTVTTVGPHGELQSMTFFEGQFKLAQGKNGQVLAELTGGNFSICPTVRERAHVAIAAVKRASPKHVVRKLWAEGHGTYTTKGNYAAGAVLGTRWLTEDLCDGTLIRVATDKVAVTNLVNHRKKTVKAGQHYLAKAP